MTHHMFYVTQVSSNDTQETKIIFITKYIVSTSVGSFLARKIFNNIEVGLYFENTVSPSNPSIIKVLISALLVNPKIVQNYLLVSLTSV